MKVSTLLFAIVASASCTDSAAPAAPDAPAATEPLELTLAYRGHVAGERLPTVTISGRLASVRVRVMRQDLCATIASAAINRSAHVLSFVARVSPHPAALCTPDPGVVEYEGSVGGVLPGVYTVRVYEAVGDGPPRFMAAAAVVVR